MSSKVRYRLPLLFPNSALSRLLLAGFVFTLGATSSAYAAFHPRGSTMLFDDAKNLTWLFSDPSHTAAIYAMAAGTIFDDGFSPTDGRLTYAGAQAWVGQLAILNEDNGAIVSGWRLPSIDTSNPGINELVGHPGGNPPSGFSWFGQLVDLPPPVSCDIMTVEGHLICDGQNWPPVLAWATGGFAVASLTLPRDGGQAIYAMEGYAFAVHEGDVSSVPLPSAILLLFPAIAIFGTFTRRS